MLSEAGKILQDGDHGSREKRFTGIPFDPLQRVLNAVITVGSFNLIDISDYRYQSSGT